MRQVSRVLFIRTDRMGDVLMNIPALRLLRQTYPKCWLTLMADRAVAELLRGHPDLDEILEVDGSEIKRSSAYRSRLLRRVRQARFDLGIASNPDKFFHWMMFRAGIPIRVGWRRKWGFLLTRSLVDHKSIRKQHEIDSNLMLAGLISSKKWDGEWNFSANADISEKIDSRLAKEMPEGREIVAVHPGTSDPAKRWKAKNFSEVCSRLAMSGRYTPLLIGGSEEEPISREVARGCSERVTDWTGALDLRELTALLGNRRVRALVSSDSGPAHVAWIQRKPVIVLFAKNAPGSDPVRWGPLNPGSVTIHKDMDAITPDEVFAALAGVLA